MKYLITLLCFLPAISFAYPALGDFVHYEAKYDNSLVTYEKKVLAHDQASDAFEVRTLIIFKGEIVKDATHVLPRSFLYSPQKVESVLKNCFAREGMITAMVVAGKKMNVCEFYDEGSQLTYMIGPVPFGQVRFQEYMGDGEFLDFHLTYFSSL